MLDLLNKFAQDYGGYEYSTYSLDTAEKGALGAFFIAYLVVVLAVVVVTIIGMWKVFEKAGKPGWAAIVPIYNVVVLLQIVGRPVWWVLLYLVTFIPFVGWIVGLVVGIIVSNDLSKSFGKDVVMTVLLVLLPFIGFPMLGFSKDRYLGPAALKGNHPGHPGAGAPPAAPAA